MKKTIANKTQEKRKFHKGLSQKGVSLLERALKAAQKARLNAHAPYSGYLVGAAIVTAEGKIFSGCNVENASYGGTNCAERTAIFKAVSEIKKLKIAHVIVVTDESNPWPPCGLCRQIISEFANEGAWVHLANLKGIQSSLPFSEVFPSSFSSVNLSKN